MVVGLNQSLRSMQNKVELLLDRRHTVFGQLVDAESFAVLDAIAAVETGAMDKPVEDVVIKTIEIED